MSHRLSAVKYFLLGALLLLGTWNCRKDVDEFRPYAYEPSQASINQLLGQVFTTTNVHTYTLKNITQDTTLTTPTGVRVALTDPDALFADANNHPIAASSCQNLQIEITEVLSKGDLLSRGIHTATYPDGKLLESGGIVYIRATCDGTPLKLLPNRDLKVQLPATTQQNDMLSFHGTVQNETNFQGWEPTGDPAYLAEWVVNGQMVHGYELYPNQLGWVGAGRPLPESTSGFCVQLPPGMTDETAQVFVVFKGRSTVAVSKYTDNSQSFCFDQAPEGYPVQVVTVSKLGEQYWLGSKETEIGHNSNLEVTPQETTESELVDFLKHL